MNKIILASTSYIRKKMLEDNNIEFTAISPLCDEDEIKQQNNSMNLSELAVELAKAKAIQISKDNFDRYVIGSDQICEFEEKAISKSKNKEEAFKSLKRLSGNTHKQNNGICVFFNGTCVFEHKETAYLTMKQLSDDEIKEYIRLDNPIGCAGSYKFELNGKSLFEKIEGKAEAIQGFCLSPVIEFLKSKKGL